MGRKTIEITHPYLTIAGQTAPGPGITLIRTGIDVKTHDVVMRHLRVYTGVDGQSKRSGWEADTFSTVAAQNEIGRASCREGVWQYVEITVVAGYLKQKKKNKE